MTGRPGNDKSRRVPADVQAQQRDKFVREHNAKMRAESNAKMAKLKALRLAKEAGDKAENLKQEEEKSRRRAGAQPRQKRWSKF